MADLSINFANSCKNATVAGEDTKRFKMIIKKLLKEESKKRCEISFIFVDNDTISTLNARYRKKAAPTDVLSFGLYQNSLDNIPYGDVYISLDRIKSQAKDYEVSFKQELFRIIVHGTLHLLGYDHQTTSEEQVMNKKTERWLDKFSNKRRR